MMKKTERRHQRLLPDGVPRYIRVYDNGGGLTKFCRACLNFSDADLCDVAQCGHKTLKADGGSFDRYTVVFSGNYAGRNGQCHYLTMSRYPFHPQGFGQHGEHDRPIDAPSGFPPAVGDKVPFGRRITFHQLPPDCQKAVLHDYRIIWGLEKNDDRKEAL
jgi:hypothetical protein